MIYKLQAQAGSCRDSMWCGPAEQTGMPSPSEQDDWGACTFFGGVPPRSPYGVQGAARCELIPRLHLAAVIEGSLGILGDSDLSRSSTLSGQHGYADERHIVRQRSGLSLRTVGATSVSGGIHGLSARMELKSMSHWSRKTGNPHVEKVLQHRPRQSFA